MEDRRRAIIGKLIQNQNQERNLDFCIKDGSIKHDTIPLWES